MFSFYFSDKCGDEVKSQKCQSGGERRKLTGYNMGEEEAKKRCIKECKKITGATGCEIEYNRNLDCYVHTGAVSVGEGLGICMVFHEPCSGNTRFFHKYW